MDKSGRKQLVLFTEARYKDDITGLPMVSTRATIMWADEGFLDQIKNLKGVSAAFYGQAEKGRYDIYFDPRYDIEYVKREIEALIVCEQDD